MALIHVSELPPQRAEEAFGLVRLGSTCSEAEWHRLVLPSAGDSRGVICATAFSGVMLGIAAYEVDDRMPAGRLLKIGLFVAFELGGRGGTAVALRNALDGLAERLGCEAIAFPEHSRGSGLPELA